MWFVYILFPRVDFCSSNFNKDDLKQDQKEEGRSKAKKIIVEGNLNSSFVFCFKEHFNFVVFQVSLQGWVMPQIFPNVYQIFEPYLSDCIRKNTYVKSFRRIAKENHVWFYERHLMKKVTKKAVWNIILFCQMKTFQNKNLKISTGMKSVNLVIRSP